MTSCILIPARYESTRFPGKMLAKVNGIPLIVKVAQNMLSTQLEVNVVTDHEKIQKACDEFQVKSLLVQDDVPNGSMRIWLAYERFLQNKNFQYLINVQGDEPLLKAEIVQDLIKFHQSSKFDIATLLKKRLDDEISNPNVVKCAYSSSSQQCLYFSRAPIPYNRDTQADSAWYQHIGVYSYQTQALKEFVQKEESALEKIEKLEQLRALENGLTIGATFIPENENLIGVDTKEDLEKVNHLLLQTS